MLVFKRRYRYIGRKPYLSRKVEKNEADGDDKKIEKGEGIDDVDSSNIDESGSDEKSSIETISNFTEEESVNDDKESNMSNEEEVVNDDTEDGVDEEEVSVKDDDVTPTTAVKRKYPPSVIDFLINNNTDKTSIPVPTKLHCFDSSISSRDNDDFDTHQNKLLNEKKDHALIKIPPTKQRKYSQKACAHCRQKYGIRKDTRYICTLCNVALCQEPCFSDYHCNK